MCVPLRHKSLTLVMPCVRSPVIQLPLKKYKEPTDCAAGKRVLKYNERVCELSCDLVL